MKNNTVTIREKKGAKGASIYLDIYSNGKREYKFLNLFLKKTNSEKENNLLRLQAERERANILEQIYNGTYIFKCEKNTKILTFADLINVWLEDKKTKSAYNTYRAYKAFKNSVLDTFSLINEKIEKINKNFCLEFLKHLSTIKAQRVNKGELLAEKSKNNYWLRFVNLINFAIRKGYITNNPLIYIEREEKPKAVNSERAYLTENEIKSLLSVTNYTEYEKKYLRVFLFSCYSGLRISDLCNLTYKNFELTENQQVRLKVLTQKTKKYISFILPQNSLQLIDIKKISTTQKVFDLSIYTKNRQAKYFSQIAKKANITKHISFHIARHTFATLLLTKGVDIYTVATMLGHSDITTTQIYAKIIDTKKDNAAALLDF